MELKHFKTNDFDCSCGCGLLPKEDVMLKADEIREKIGIPLVVSSGARCRAKQDKLILQGVTKAKNSKHVSLEAVDLAPYLQRRSDESIAEFNIRSTQTMKKLHDFVIENAKDLNIWIEHPDYTLTWAHIQIVPYPSWSEGLSKTKSRVFRP